MWCSSSKDSREVTTQDSTPSRNLCIPTAIAAESKRETNAELPLLYLEKRKLQTHQNRMEGGRWEQRKQPVSQKVSTQQVSKLDYTPAPNAGRWWQTLRHRYKSNRKLGRKTSSRFLDYQRMEKLVGPQEKFRTINRGPVPWHGG